MPITALDHLVLTVADPQITAAFYVRVLGMERIDFAQGRIALHFGQQKINLHPSADPLTPHAAQPTAGSADLCFVSTEPLAFWLDRLADCAVPVEAGPVARTGALGPMQSIYLRDPDGNLIEIAYYG